MTTVNDQPKLLISLLEEEKSRLQKLIIECLAETEYLMAHYHSEALNQVNCKLQTLNNIEDELYDKKDYEQRRIDILQKQIERESSDHMKKYYGKEPQRSKEKLEKLNQIPKQAAFSGEVTLLDEMLAKLLENKIKNVKLILKNAAGFFLGFNYSNRILKVTLPNVKNHTKKRILYDDTINSFKRLGFHLNDNGTRLTLTLSGDKEIVSNRLKIILSKIVFEIFYFKEFNNESYIQFTEKGHRYRLRHALMLPGG